MLYHKDLIVEYCKHLKNVDIINFMLSSKEIYQLCDPIIVSRRMETLLKLFELTGYADFESRTGDMLRLSVSSWDKETKEFESILCVFIEEDAPLKNLLSFSDIGYTNKKDIFDRLSIADPTLEQQKYIVNVIIYGGYRLKRINPYY